MNLTMNNEFKKNNFISFEINSSFRRSRTMCFDPNEGPRAGWGPRDHHIPRSA